MAILAIFEGKMSKAQYDSLRKEVNWEGVHPAGMISHAAAFEESGQVHVADVWESEEAINTFFKERLMPGMKKLGMSMPEGKMYPAYNVNNFKALEKVRV
jgi:hypothetical protein